MKHSALTTALLFTIWFSLSPAYALTLGQTDQFESGTTLNWTSGTSFFSARVNPIPSGGPAGSGDGYLDIAQNNFHIAVFNTSQWTGNYLVAGIDAIAMDLTAYNNDHPLGIRLVLYGPGGAFTSAQPTFTTDSWDRRSFGLSESDLIPLSGSAGGWPGGGTGLLADTLAAVSRLQIRNDPGPTPTPIGSHPEHITANLAVDNITAVPEPATLTLILTAALYLRRPKRTSIPIK